MINNNQQTIILLLDFILVTSEKWWPLWVIMAVVGHVIVLFYFVYFTFCSDFEFVSKFSFSKFSVFWILIFSTK